MQVLDNLHSSLKHKNALFAKYKEKLIKQINNDFYFQLVADCKIGKKMIKLIKNNFIFN